MTEFARALQLLSDNDAAPETQQVKAVPLSVERFLSAFQKQQEASAKECISLAEWFEDNAVWLRNRAATMVHMATQIPADVSQATLYERESNDRVQFLSALRK